MRILKSESPVYPLLVDDTSSPTSVFVHENIEEVTRQDESGEEYTYYTMTQIIYTRDEWDKLKNAEAILDLYAQIAELKGA